MGIGKIRESKGDWHDIDHTNHQVPFVFESIWKTTYPQCFLGTEAGPLHVSLY